MGKRKRVYPCPWCDEFEEPVIGVDREFANRKVRICPVCRGPRPLRCSRYHLHSFDKQCFRCGRWKYKPPPKKKGQQEKPSNKNKKRRRQKRNQD